MSWYHGYERLEEIDKSGKNQEGKEKLESKRGRTEVWKKEKGTSSKLHIYIPENELNPVLQGNVAYDYIFKIFIPLQ